MNKEIYSIDFSFVQNRTFGSQTGPRFASISLVAVSQGLDLRRQWIFLVESREAHMCGLQLQAPRIFVLTCCLTFTNPGNTLQATLKYNLGALK